MANDDSKLVTFEEAFESGHWFRHISVRHMDPVWIRKITEDKVLVDTNNDIMAKEDFYEAGRMYEYKPVD